MYMVNGKLQNRILRNVKVRITLSFGINQPRKAILCQKNKIKNALEKEATYSV